MSVFGVIQSECGKIRTRITPNRITSSVEVRNVNLKEMKKKIEEKKIKNEDTQVMNKKPVDTRPKKNLYRIFI